MVDFQHQGITRVNLGAPLPLLSYRAQPGRRASLPLAWNVAKGCVQAGFGEPSLDLHPHPGGNPWANLKSISHTYHPILVAFVWELTKETIHLPLGCLQGGLPSLTLLSSLRTLKPGAHPGRRASPTRPPPPKPPPTTPRSSAHRLLYHSAEGSRTF